MEALRALATQDTAALQGPPFYEMQKHSHLSSICEAVEDQAYIVKCFDVLELSSRAECLKWGQRAARVPE